MCTHVAGLCQYGIRAHGEAANHGRTETETVGTKPCQYPTTQNACSKLTTAEQLHHTESEKDVIGSNTTTLSTTYFLQETCGSKKRMMMPWYMWLQERRRRPECHFRAQCSCRTQMAWGNPLPTVLGLWLDQWLRFEHADCTVSLSSDGRSYEVDTRHHLGKFGIQLLQKIGLTLCHQAHYSPLQKGVYHKR